MAKKCMSCGGSMNKMAKGGIPKAQKGIVTKVMSGKGSPLYQEKPSSKYYPAPFKAPVIGGGGPTPASELEKYSNWFERPTNKEDMKKRNPAAFDSKGNYKPFMNIRKKGGSTSFGMLSVKAGVDKNPKPTAADRIAGAKMKKGGSTDGSRLERLSNKIDKKNAAGKSVSNNLTKRYDKAVDKVIVSGMKKMAKGGMMKAQYGTSTGPDKGAYDTNTGMQRTTSSRPPMAKKGGTTKMAKGGMMKGTVGGAPKKPFAAGIPYYTGAGQTGPESMQLGGALKGVKALYRGSKIVKKVQSLANNKITKGATGPMTKTAMRLKATGKKK